MASARMPVPVETGRQPGGEGVNMPIRRAAEVGAGQPIVVRRPLRSLPEVGPVSAPDDDTVREVADGQPEEPPSRGGVARTARRTSVPRGGCGRRRISTAMTWGLLASFEMPCPGPLRQTPAVRLSSEPVPVNLALRRAIG